jgi:hypothetical protein
MRTELMRPPAGLARALFLAAASVLSACNLVFGIEGGTPRGAGGTGGEPIPPCTNVDATLRWATTSASPAYTQANSVAFTPEGDVVVAGVFADGEFSMGNTTVPNADTTSSTQDIFLARLDRETGLPVWAKAFTGAGEQHPLDVAVDPVSGDIVLAGRMEASISFDGGATTLTSLGDYDAFLARFTADGDHVWSKSYGNASYQAALRVAVDGGGNVLATVLGGDELDFGDGPVGLPSETSFFVVKLDPGGGVVWKRHYPIGYDGGEYAGLAVDADDNVVIAGATTSDANLNSPDPFRGGTDVFVTAFDPAGKYRWSRIFGGTRTPQDQNGYQFATAVAFDAQGDVLVTGGFAKDLEVGETLLTNVDLADESDVFVLKLAGADGAPVWAKAFGDTGRQLGISIGADDASRVVVSGILFDDAASTGIDFGSCTKRPPPGDDGGDYHEDLFIARYTAAGDHLWSERFGDQFIQKGEIAVHPSGAVAVAGDFFFGIHLDDTPEGDLVDPQREMFAAVFDP